MKKQEQLQFLRFLAFLLIFSLHAGGWLSEEVPIWKNAFEAVAFFFLLSGWTVGYASDRIPKVSVAGIVCFVKKKLLRYYPLYLVMMVVAILMGTKTYPAEVVANLLLVQTWVQHFQSICSAGWYLSDLFLFQIFTVPLVGFLKWFLRKGRYVPRLLLLIGITMGGTVLYHYAIRNTFLFFWAYMHPAARAGEYILGILLGMATLHYKKTQAASCGFGKWLLFSVGEAAVLCLFLYMPYTRAMSWMPFVANWLVTNSLLLMIFAVGQGGVSSLFRQRIFVYLGNIAFECYLIHPAVIQVFQGLSPEEGLVHPYVVYVACLMTSVALSAGVHWLDGRIRR